MTALALVATFALAGAQPAAAMNLNLAHRLTGLWSAAISAGPASLWSRLAHWLGGEEKSAMPDNPARIDANWGMEPDGNH